MSTVQNLFFQGVDKSAVDLEMDAYAKELEAAQMAAKKLQVIQSKTEEKPGIMFKHLGPNDNLKKLSTCSIEGLLQKKPILNNGN